MSVVPLATTQYIRACNARDPLTNWGGPAIFLVLSKCINSRGCSDDRKIIDHVRFVDRALPISNCGAGIDGEEHAFMRSLVGNGSPKSWWTLQLWERAG